MTSHEGTLVPIDVHELERHVDVTTPDGGHDFIGSIKADEFHPHAITMYVECDTSQLDDALVKMERLVALASKLPPSMQTDAAALVAATAVIGSQRKVSRRQLFSFLRWRK